MSSRFELTPHHRNVPDEELLEDVRRVASELGRSTVTIDQYNERGTYHSSSLARRFGTWLKALDRAGLAKSRNLHITNEELFSNLAALWMRLRRQPRYSDLTSQVSRFSAGTYEDRFGSWRKALEAFVQWSNAGETHPSTSKAGNLGKKHHTTRTINYRLRFLVMRRDKFKCRLSGRSPATDPSVILEVDHIIPWDKGGETVIDNLQTLAKEINIGKSNLSMSDDV